MRPVGPGPLQDRVVLITGASSGLGEAMARSCARDGARVALAARREERLRALAAELEAIGAAALVIPTNMRDPEAMRAMAAATRERFGRIDVLVANAGVGHAAPVMETTEEQLRVQLAGRRAMVSERLAAWYYRPRG